MTGQERGRRLADWLIRRSGRRLPDGTREQRLREWTAELTAILDDAGITRLRAKPGRSGSAWASSGRHAG